MAPMLIHLVTNVCVCVCARFKFHLVNVTCSDKNKAPVLDLSADQQEPILNVRI